MVLSSILQKEYPLGCNKIDSPVIVRGNQTLMGKKNGKIKSVKNKGGRPPIWTDPKVLKKLVDNYFDTEKRPTLAGLACALDISRSTLYEYDKKDSFSYIIKKAREKVEKIYEDILLYGNRPTGVIFALKNMGWRDRRDIDHTTKGKELPVPILGGASNNVQKDDSIKEDKQSN